MKIYSSIRQLIILSILAVSFLAEAQTGYPKVIRNGREYIQYTVPQGEGMYAICKKFNVKYEDVATVNPDIRNGLKLGQQLLIPVATNGTTEPIASADGRYEENGFFYHTVEQGETLYSIARSYGVDVNRLTKQNPESEEGLKVGLMLKVPQVSELPSASNGTKMGSESSKYRFHTIAPKETPYSVSKKYHISIRQLLEENPALTTENFSIGRVIRIPYVDIPVTAPPIKQVTVKKDSIYIIQKKETLFGISKRFNVEMAELIRLNPAIRTGVKDGMTIRIPINIVQTVVEDRVETAVAQELGPDLNELIREATKAKPQDQLHVALMLPFHANQPNHPDSYRFIEYYEGFLLAVEKLKTEGVSITLHVFDTGNGTTTVNQLLNKPDFAEMDLIIGPVYNDQIALVADYSKRNKKLMVIPFTSKNDDILTNPYLFQINTPQSYLFSEVAQSFCKRFKGCNVLFLDNPNIKSDKEEFLSSMKSEMKRVGLTFSTYSTTVDTLPELRQHLATDKKNIIIPTSGTNQLLEHFMPSLRLTAELNQEYDLSLFGYPEWQTYTKDFIEAFYQLNTTIYTSFFIDNKESDFKQFYRRFVMTYSKDLRNTFPKYGVLGYDSGLYFLRGINKWGTNFEMNASKFKHTGIQTGFSFERLNAFGGYINKKAYLVHFMKDFRIEKTEIKEL